MHLVTWLLCKYHQCNSNSNMLDKSNSQDDDNITKKKIRQTDFRIKTCMWFHYFQFQPTISRKKSSKRSLLTTWKLRKFTVTLLWQKFRESNVFTKENTKESIWRNFLCVTVNFSFSTLCYVLLCTSWEILREIDVKSIYLISRNFC